MASNPYANKIEYDGNTLIDLTADTVTASSMLSGVTAHSASGAPITGNIASKAAASYTPTTFDQTIAAGQYLSGVQTILGDPNLIAENIKNGVSIFNVLGTYEGGGSIEMESGIFTPSSDTARPTISFSKTHSTPPSFAWAAISSFPNSSSNIAFVLVDCGVLFGFPVKYNSSNNRYGLHLSYYRGTGSASSVASGQITYGSDNAGSSDTSYYQYYATPSAFKPYTGSGQRYWRNGTAIKWAAYWL